MPNSRLPLALLASAICTLAVSSSAHAASPMNCDASALRLSVLGQPAAEPITANRNSSKCANAQGPTTLDLSSTPIPLTAGVVSASTRGSGDRDTQRALALGGIANLNLGALSALQLPDLTAQIPAQLKTVSIPLGPIATQFNLVLAPLGIVLPQSIDVDLAGAIKSLTTQLPNVSVLTLGTANAFAGATCQNGKAVPFSAPQLADLSILGQNVGLTGPVSGALQILNSQSIDLSKIDVTTLVLPDVLTKLGASAVTKPVLTAIQTLIKTTLGALPPITIPAQVANIAVTPGAKTDVNGKLTQHALDVHVELLGQTLVDGTIGEAMVTTANVDCTPVAAPAAAQPSASDLTLQCTTRSLVLTDVIQRGKRVRLIGAADKKLAGKTVDIKFDATGKRVATTKVKSDGSFTTTAALPSKRLRSTNKARYKAVIGSKSSLNLKLARRMIVSSMTAKGGKVTIKGRVVKPLGKPVAKVKVQRRVSCKKTETVKTVTPKSDGSFSVTVDGPTGAAAAVYRLATKVRNNTKSRKLFDTFTLPRGINLKQ